MSGSRLEILKQIAKALAAQFGNDCEIVIHDLKKNLIDESIIYIENGHVSGRELGGAPSQIVLDTIKHHENVTDKLNYLTRADNGHILKSSTIFIKDEDEIRYILAINYDITNLLAFKTTLDNILINNTEDNTPKHINNNVNELLDELIDQSIKLVGVPVAAMTKDDKIKAIKYLNDSGAFLITKSGDKIAKFFNISKYTLYSYVDINK